MPFQPGDMGACCFHFGVCLCNVLMKLRLNWSSVDCVKILWYVRMEIIWYDKMHLSVMQLKKRFYFRDSLTANFNFDHRNFDGGRKAESYWSWTHLYWINWPGSQDFTFDVAIEYAVLNHLSSLCMTVEMVARCTTRSFCLFGGRRPWPNLPSTSINSSSIDESTACTGCRPSAPRCLLPFGR